MVIHFHLSLTDRGLDQLMDRLGLAAAAAEAAPALASAAVCIAAGRPVGPSVGPLSAAAVICARGSTCAGPGLAASRALALGTAASGIIGAGAAGIGAALATLGVSAGHNNDLFLLRRLFSILCGFFIFTYRFLLFCHRFFPLIFSRSCHIAVVFRLISFLFKLIRYQLDCALLNILSTLDLLLNIL